MTVEKAWSEHSDIEWSDDQYLDDGQSGDEKIFGRFGMAVNVVAFSQAPHGRD